MTLTQIQTKIRFFLKKPTNERDAVIRKNVLSSLAYQFFTNLLGLLVVPLSLSYIDKEKYGIWINASVMVAWLQNMNFGMGFGMQNKVTEALAHNKPGLAKEYVTIVYRYSTLIALGLLVLGIGGSFFINWNSLFNSSTTSATELRSITFIAFFCFLLYFVAGNIAPLFNALQKTAVPKLFGLLTSVLTLVFLYSIHQFSHNNLVYAAIALALPVPLIYLAGNIFYFRKKFAFLKPGWFIKDKKHVKDVFSLGLKFFMMQLTTLVLTQSGVFIITQYLGPTEVTPYSIINRYFYFGFFIFSLALTPYWSGFTEAYVKKDFIWIRKALKQLIIAAMAGSVIILAMMAAAFLLIPIWTKNAFDIHQYTWLVYTGALYVITLFFSTIVSTFLNGISALNYQLVVQIVIAILTIILSIILISVFHLGSVAINITAIVAQLIYLAFCSRYTYVFLKRSAITVN